MYYGMQSFMKMTFQNTFGAAETSSSQAFGFKSESLNKTIEQITSKPGRKRFLKRRFTSGKRHVKGNLSLDAFPTVMAYALKSVLFSSTVESNGYRHSFDVACYDYNGLSATNLLTAEIHRGGDNSQYYYDLNGNSLAVNIKKNDFVSLELDMLGTSQVESTKSNPVYLDEEPFFYNQVSMGFDGNPEMNIDEMTLTIQNNLEPRYNLGITSKPRRIARAEEMTIGLTATLNCQSNSYFNAFNNQSEHNITIAMANSYGSVEIEMGDVKVLNYESNISDPGVITGRFEATVCDSVFITVINSFMLLNEPFMLDDNKYGKLGYNYNPIGAE